MKNFLLMTICICCAAISVQSEKVAVLQFILNTPEFKDFHHRDLKGRVPLFLLNKKGLFSEQKILEINPKVVLLEDTTGTKGNYIRIDKLDIDEKKAEFILYYKIENMHMAGSLIKKEKNWQIKKFDYIIET